MTNKRRNILLLAGGGLLLIIIAFGTQQPHSPQAEKATAVHDSIAVMPFQTGNGEWGYDVNVGSRTLIHQDMIPALPGRAAFHTREEALRVGQKVAEKLRQGRMPPSITKTELKELGIAQAR